MLHCKNAARRSIRYCALVLVSAAFSFAAPISSLAAERSSALDEQADEVRLLVLDIELLGDLSDPALAPEHAARIQMASERLRDALAKTPFYEIVDRTPARELIDRLSSTQYMHKCNGCEIDIALKLGAEEVMVVWIHRVSNLILSLTYEMREVPSGKPIRRRSFDFRGDNDQSWAHAVDYMVRDLAERMEK